MAIDVPVVSTLLKVNGVTAETAPSKIRELLRGASYSEADIDEAVLMVSRWGSVAPAPTPVPQPVPGNPLPNTTSSSFTLPLPPLDSLSNDTLKIQTESEPSWHLVAGKFGSFVLFPITLLATVGAGISFFATIAILFVATVMASGLGTGFTTPIFASIGIALLLALPVSLMVSGFARAKGRENTYTVSRSFFSASLLAHHLTSAGVVTVLIVIAGMSAGIPGFSFGASLAGSSFVFSTIIALINYIRDRWSKKPLEIKATGSRSGEQACKIVFVGGTLVVLLSTAPLVLYVMSKIQLAVS